MFTVYILKSITTSRYYIGSTKNLHERLHRHNSNRNISTRHRGPWVLVYQEQFPDKQSAWIREQQIKNMRGGNSFKKIITERWPSG